MAQRISWEAAWTFNDYVVYLVASKKTDSNEFKFLLRTFGREKLAQIWKDHKQPVKINPGRSGEGQKED